MTKSPQITDPISEFARAYEENPEQRFDVVAAIGARVDPVTGFPMPLDRVTLAAMYHIYRLYKKLPQSMKAIFTNDGRSHDDPTDLDSFAELVLRLVNATRGQRLYEAVSKNRSYEDVRELLVTSGMDPNGLPNTGSESLLYLASRNSRYDVVALLKWHGAVPTPQSYALQGCVIRKDCQMLRALLDGYPRVYQEELVRESNLLKLAVKENAGNSHEETIQTIFSYGATDHDGSVASYLEDDPYRNIAMSVFQTFREGARAQQNARGGTAALNSAGDCTHHALSLSRQTIKT